jgi:prepilin-type N-terminal cleavage/methylation domain-containing protein
MKHDTAQSNAFTIVELLVVIAIFAIVVVAVVPAVGTFMEQMNTQQAYEMMAAQISLAQSIAPTRGTYTAVHVQRADGDPNVRDVLDVEETTSFVGIFQLNVVDAGSGANQQWPGTPSPAWSPQEPNTANDKWMRFQLAEGYEVRRLPGDMAFGQIDSEFVNDDGTYKAIDTDAKLADFTSFSVVFDSSGVLMTTVDAGRNPQFDADGEMFDDGNDNLWSIDTTNNQGDYNNTSANDLPGEPGVRAYTMFRYPDMPASNRADWLYANTQILPITSYTGEVFLRE